MGRLSGDVGIDRQGAEESDEHQDDRSQRRQQAGVGEGEGVGDDGNAVDQQDGRLGAGK